MITKEYREEIRNQIDEDDVVLAPYARICIPDLLDALETSESRAEQAEKGWSYWYEVALQRKEQSDLAEAERDYLARRLPQG